MDWKLHIAQRRKHGWTLSTIAAHVGAPVSTISELARGCSKEPRWSLGVSIQALPERPPTDPKHEAPAEARHVA